MILQSLISLYDRLEGVMPPYGFSVEDIGFVVTLDKDGNMIGQPEDLRVKVKANIYGYRESVVPYSNKVNVRSAKGAAETPNFMVDKADYVFGMSGNSLKGVHRKSFRGLIGKVCGDFKDEGAFAVKQFLSSWSPKQSVELRDWKEISGNHGKWIAFRLQEDRCFVHERPAVRKLWSDYFAKEVFPTGVSFLDGLEHPLQGQYAQFKFGSGASLVSFNEVAYESYGKKKGENAPISVIDEFKSSTALKYLLRCNSHRTKIGDATTLSWAERKSAMEPFLGIMLDPGKEDQTANIPVQKFLEAVRQGVLPTDLEQDKDLKFYILGLSLNRARLALRFWHVCTVKDLMEKFRDHFQNLEIERSEKDVPIPGIWHLLKETARESKDISPVLAGELTRSILTGFRYPQTLFQGVMGRIRADQSKRYKNSVKSVQNVNYLRASILKAILTRNYKMEVPMSLDTERREIGYLLGRLFAALEKAQLDALGNVNATIKDRFFSAAAATPASVFPRLLRLSQHHIGKAEYGHISDRRIANIMEHVDVFPPHMDLRAQGLFAIAYYQQKNAFKRDIQGATAKKKIEKK